MYVIDLIGYAFMLGMAGCLAVFMLLVFVVVYGFLTAVEEAFNYLFATKEKK